MSISNMSCCLLQAHFQQEDAEIDAQDGVSQGGAPSTSAAAADQEDSHAESMQHDEQEQGTAQTSQAVEQTDHVAHDHPPESTTGVHPSALTR
jgi:hypothetical protein